MDLKLAFRCVLLLELVLSVVVLPVTVAVSSPLPRDLMRYLDGLSAIPVDGPLAWLLPACELAAMLGLFFFVRGARELYVAMLALSSVHKMFEGMPAVLPAATYVCVQLERLVAGVIVGLAYGSALAGQLSLRRVGRTSAEDG